MKNLLTPIASAHLGYYCLQAVTVSDSPYVIAVFQQYSCTIVVPIRIIHSVHN